MLVLTEEEASTKDESKVCAPSDQQFDLLKQVLVLAHEFLVMLHRF